MRTALNSLAIRGTVVDYNATMAHRPGDAACAGAAPRSRASAKGSGQAPERGSALPRPRPRHQGANSKRVRISRVPPAAVLSSISSPLASKALTVTAWLALSTSMRQ